jgi:uncharacterized RDD family membrane protein YckC
MESSGQPGPAGSPETGTSGTSGGAPSWQSTPDPAAGTRPGGSWAAPAAQSTVASGPAGYYYADVPNRIIALIIDAIILFIIQIIVGIVLGAILGPTVNADFSNPNFGTVNWTSAIVSAIVNLAISAAYFAYFWTTSRATPGQRVLGMQVGSETDGATLTLNQALTRWALLFLPSSISFVFYGLPTIGILWSLLVLIYYIALLVTTAQSPTKQGLHDRYAHTVVVKAGRAAA